MMFPGHAASSPSGYGQARGSSILPGNNWDLIENLMAHAVNSRGRPIHFSKDSRPEEWCYSWAASDRMAGELQRPVRVKMTRPSGKPPRTAALGAIGATACPQP